MIQLFTTFYLEKNPNRRDEYEECFRRNRDSGLFSAIYILTEEPEASPQVESTTDTKIVIQRQPHRPTFSEIFQFINSVTEPDNINVLSNTDIIFDNSLRLVEQINMKDVCLALTRWDIQVDNTIRFLESIDSQDCWIFKGKIQETEFVKYPSFWEDANFHNGLAGIDNRIAFIINQLGYHVINPSYTIKIQHLHRVNVRNYNPENRVLGQYLLLPPTILEF